MNLSADTKRRVDRRIGLAELAEILVKEDKIEDAAKILGGCYAKAPWDDSGATIFAVRLLECCNQSQVRKVTSILDEWMPPTTRGFTQWLLTARAKATARCMDEKGLSSTLGIVNRLKAKGEVLPGFSPLRREERRESLGREQPPRKT